MSKKNDIQKTEENLQEVEQALTSAEVFIEKNQKPITMIFGGAVVVALLILAYVHFYQGPREVSAQEEIFMAEQYFQKDSFQLAVDGDGNYPGFLDIIDNYGGTKAGNLSNYYTGVAYLHLGEYENAIEYLSDFSSDDMILSAVALGAQGDAYAELDKKEKAVSMYMDAASANENKLTAPIYLLKAGKVYEELGKKEDALKVYTQIKENYKKSSEASSIDKFIARVSN